MAGFDRNVRIERPVPEVWDYFLDERNLPRWMPEIVAFEKVTEGPVGLGTRYRETRRIGKREHTEELEITAFEENRTYAGTVDAHGIRGTYTYRFTPEGNGTRVDLLAEVRGRGLGKLFVRMAVKAMKKSDGDQLALLKRAIEAT